MTNTYDNDNLREYCDKKSTYQSFINAMPYSAAILDQNGVILCVNKKWKEFGKDNDLSMKDYGLGACSKSPC